MDQFSMQTKRISADEAHNARKAHLRQGPDGKERLLKVASAPSTWNAEKRSARFVMTSQSVDRYGDIVVTAGLNLTEFEKNPIAFLNHASSQWPIGTWKNTEKLVRTRPPRMEGDLVLLEEGSPVKEAETAAWMIERGYMRACSIGFIPNFDEVEAIMNEAGEWSGGLKFNKSELIETSLCGVPANQDALAKDFAEHAGFAFEAVEDVLDNWARDADGDLIQREAFEHLYKVLPIDYAGPSVEEILASLEPDAATAVCEKYLATAGKMIMDKSRVDAIELAARNKRLDEKRKRQIEALNLRGSC